MPLQYINEMLEIPELHIHKIWFLGMEEIHLEAVPAAYIQACPACHSPVFVERDGSNNPRKVRHLAVFGKNSYLHVPSIRMVCSFCRIRFVWTYDFVGPKQRYSLLFRSQCVEQALGSTAAHSARMQGAPASTVQRMQQEALPAECERLYEQAWSEAKAAEGLVLGIDDFAIKKGHTYNTGIHNLRGETMLEPAGWPQAGRLACLCRAASRFPCASA